MCWLSYVEQLRKLPRLELGTFDVIPAAKIVENIRDILRLEVQYNYRGPLIGI